MHIKNLKSEDLYFTSDSHFGHDNIIKYCGRPYKNVHDMNEDMIERWNKKVPNNGIVFHLGDLAFKNHGKVTDYLSRLSGQIYITVGNHDRQEDLIKAHRFVQVADLFDVIVEDEEMEDRNQKVTLCHYPLTVWNQKHRGAWQFFGHCHGTYDSPYFEQVDVGVDTNNFTPWSWQELKEHITMKAMKRK